MDQAQLSWLTHFIWNIEFYDCIFYFKGYTQQANRQSTGISDRNRLYVDSFKQMSNLMLPQIKQEEIVAFITAEISRRSTAIACTECEISLM